MADSIVKYTADGTTTDYSITFSYIARANVVVLVAGVVSTDFTFINNSTIQFNTALPLAAWWLLSGLHQQYHSWTSLMALLSSRLI